jgi:hypothetical protein
MDHDQRFKVLVRHFPGPFLALVLPEWAERFALPTLEWLQQEQFLDPPQGQRRVVDLAARVDLLNPLPARQPDRAPYRQAVLHVEVEAAETTEGLRAALPPLNSHLHRLHGLPVLSVAVFLKVGLDGLGWETVRAAFWEREVSAFTFPYVGLPALDGLQYLEGGNPLALALVPLMRHPAERRPWLAAEVAQRVIRLPLDEAKRYLLWECADAYFGLLGQELEAFQTLLEREEYKEARAMVQTTFERGMEKGQRTLLEIQLAQRFGPLPPETLERLRNWPSDRLTELGKTLLVAPSLKDLGLED